VVRVLEQDADLVSAHSYGSLLVAELEPRLELQQAFVRGPFVLLDPNRAAAAVPRAARVCGGIDRVGGSASGGSILRTPRLAQAAASRR
jgi:hypothetical protein